MEEAAQAPLPSPSPAAASTATADAANAAPPPRKRAVWTHTAWSATEDEVFLRAWEEVVQQRQHRNVIKALAARFDELRGAGPPRTESALGQRRTGYLRMHGIITSYHARTEEQHYADQPVYSTRDFFELSQPEQRRWVATADVPGSKSVNLDRDTYDRVGAIIAYTAEHAAVLVLSTSSTASSSTDRKRAIELPAAVGRSVSTKKPRARVDLMASSISSQPRTAVATATAYALDALDAFSSSGSSTESDDDGATQLDASDDDANNQLVKRSAIDSDLIRPRLDTSTNGCTDMSAGISTDNSSGNSSGNSDIATTSDLRKLVQLLTEQTHKLHAMIELAQREREHEDRKRRRVLLELRASHSRVLDDARRCEHALVRQSHDRKREYVDMERDLARLEQQKQMQTQTHQLQQRW